ncbi:MAG: TldD/PmbA family protein [Nitrospirae bacterium]|nr:MAG: TldD/PmbA family protein [Nitrospirota bacterium]
MPSPEFADSLVSRALGLGADQAEAYVRSSRSLSVEVKDQACDSLRSSRSFGYGLRVIRDGCLGFAYSTDPGDAEPVIRNAVDSARNNDRDSYLGLPESGDYPDVEVHDPAVAQIREEDALALAMEIEKAAQGTDRRITKVRKAAATFSESEHLIVNSRSVRASYTSTACSAQITAIAEEQGEAQVGSDYSGSRFLRDVSFGEVGRQAAGHALRLLGSRRISAQKTTVILDRSVSVDFLGILASGLSAEAVQKGRSLLSGRLGQKVMHGGITVLDNGLLPGGLGSSPFDAEGVGVRKKVLIEQGVLQGYLHNTYTAAKGSGVSTGNAVRGGFSSMPTVGITNLYIEPYQGPGRATPADLYSLAGSGLHIYDAMGVHTANPVTGDFSVGVTGIWFENGLAKYPVKEAVLSGNILDLFGKAEALGSDLRFYGNIGAPSLIITDLDISA